MTTANQSQGQNVGSSQARLEHLLEQVSALVESPENQRRLELQRRLNRRERVIAFNPWYWGGGLSVSDSLSPVPGMSVREMALNLGLVDAAFARSLVCRQLEEQLEFFKNRISDSPVATQVFTNLGLSWLYTTGALGERQEVLPETGAFITRPSLESSGEWKRLPTPSFRVDEALHQSRMDLYRKLTHGALPIIDDLVPLPIGSVFGTASRLRGDADILMDFRECPDDVHGLMRFVTDSARRFNADWREFQEKAGSNPPGATGGPYMQYIFTSICSSGDMSMMNEGEDHVSANMFSEADFLEFVFPYQKEIMAGYPKCYYHSCGNLTPFFKHLHQLPNLHRQHVSPWSDLETAVEVFGNDVILEIHQPLDFDRKTEAEIDREADRLVDLCAGFCTADVVLGDTENGRRYRKRVLDQIGMSG